MCSWVCKYFPGGAPAVIAVAGPHSPGLPEMNPSMSCVSLSIHADRKHEQLQFGTSLEGLRCGLRCRSSHTLDISRLPIKEITTHNIEAIANRPSDILTDLRGKRNAEFPPKSLFYMHPNPDFIGGPSGNVVLRCPRPVSRRTPCVNIAGEKKPPPPGRRLVPEESALLMCAGAFKPMFPEQEHMFHV